MEYKSVCKFCNKIFKTEDYETKIVYLEQDNNRSRKEAETLHQKKVAQIFWQEYNKQPRIT